MKTCRVVKWGFFVSGLAVMLSFGCGEKGTSKKQSETSGPSVVVSNYPLAFFVNELVGEDVKVLEPTIENPGEWKPDDETISAMQKADLILTVGAQYEKWPDFISLPQSKVVEVTRPMIADFIRVEGEIHKHGPDGEEHTHSGLANGFWLDPVLGKTMMGLVAEALIKTYPDRKSGIDTRRANLDRQFDKLIQMQKERQSKFSVVFSSDTRFQYLSRALGHQDVYFFWTSHGVEDLPEKAWEELDKKLETHPASVMWFTMEPSDETRSELKKRQIAVWVIDTIESRNEQDYFSRLEAVIKQVTMK